MQEGIFSALVKLTHKQFLILNANYYSIINRKHMPPYDYNIIKAPEDMKRRPSIELSPTLEKPIYIITKNMNGSHVLSLIDALEKEGIQYQLQQETSTLGFVLNQRFFVIVDNKYGEVTLGADFASLWMTIVGYPKIGKNKKNKYFERTSEVIKFFKEFKTSPQLKLSRSNLKYGEKDMVIDDLPSQMRSKIEVRSIIKYKSQDSKSQEDSHNSLKEACKRQSQKIKLIILQDKTDTEYASICQALLASQKAKDCIELASNFQEVRKKTLFHTINIKIYYLVNGKNSQDLINTIFIGEVVIFSDKQSVKINQMVNEPKIYGVAYQKGQLFKILHKIGLDSVPATSYMSSKIDPTSTFNDSKNSPFLLKNQSNIKTIDKPKIESLVKKEQPKQISKIENNISIIQQNHHSCEPSDLNASVISRASSAGRKIKRLKAKSKGKENSQAKQIIKTQTKQEAKESERKRTLKNNEYYQTTSRSKKNLTFKENLIQSTRIKRVKSIPKVQPQVFHMKEQNCPTMTESQEYYTMVTPAKTLTTSSGGNFFDRSQNSFSSSNKSKKINAFFYRQFVPKFYNIAQIIKLKPSTIFPENDKSGYMQSFVYMKEYDRFVRRVKNQLKEKYQSIEEYNFIVLLRDQDFPSFLDYCKSKNQYYDEQQCDFGSTMKESTFSCLSRTNSKINVYTFIEGETNDETISCGRFEIFKHKLMDDISDYNLSKTLACLREKMQTYGLIC